MIVSQTLYDCKCDRCGKSFVDVDNVDGVNEEQSIARLLRRIKKYGWIEVFNKKKVHFKHYCPDCWSAHRDEIEIVNK